MIIQLIKYINYRYFDTSTYPHSSLNFHTDLHKPFIPSFFSFGSANFNALARIIVTLAINIGALLNTYINIVKKCYSVSVTPVELPLSIYSQFLLSRCALLVLLRQPWLNLPLQRKTNILSHWLEQ